MSAAVQRYALREGEKARERAAAAVAQHDAAVDAGKWHDAQRYAQQAAFYAARARVMDHLRRFDLARSPSAETETAAPSKTSNEQKERISSS